MITVNLSKIKYLTQKNDIKNEKSFRTFIIQSNEGSDGSQTPGSQISSEPKNEYLTQESYDAYIENLQFHQLQCNCSASGNLIKHGHYQRWIKIPEGKIMLKITRVICKSCKKTHAILPPEIVPYSQIQLCDHLKITNAYEENSSFETIMEENPSIDEGNICYVIKQYLCNWKERLISINLSVADDIMKIAIQCLKEFGKQFMQNKSASNTVFLEPT